jgi:DegV family protein with EDD domain
MTSKGSGAYQAAAAAAEMIRDKFPAVKIEIIDTLNVSLCQGWVAIEAARDSLLDIPFGEILQNIQRIIPRVQMLQTADTLKYLHMGGRIGSAKHLLGNMLNIKPIISMRDGEIIALGQARTLQRVYQKMIQVIKESIGPRGIIKIAYVHADALEKVQELRDLVEQHVQVAETIIAELSPALGVHSGPGTIGLCYYQV